MITHSKGLMITGQRLSSLTLIAYPLTLITFLILTNGCAVKSNLPLEIPALARSDGVNHMVKKGQTLWRISKIYNVDLDKIAAANRLNETSIIKPGQNIFIPGARKDICVIDNNDNSRFIWPVKGKVYAYFKNSKNYLVNKGIDIKTRLGADIISARAGVVSFCADNLSGYEKTIIINHADGFSTVYAYNSEILVKVGDHVSQGAAIAKVGISESGKEPLLHFEIRKGHNPQNPLYYLPPQ